MKTLNAYERAILRQVLDGKSAAEISAALGIPRPVMLHVAKELFSALVTTKQKHARKPPEREV